MNSDKHINYNLRPSKSVERKMMIEVFKEVCTPSLAHDYQYIGFGASFFTDFKLVHQELNIKKMISIEGKDTELNIKRCKFNKPYRTIKVIPGKSNEILPTLDWRKKSIVWLDYDGPLKTSVFEDIEVCCQKARSGGFLIFTLRNDLKEKNFDEVKETFDDYLLPNHNNESFEPKYLSNSIREMILSVIEGTLSNEYSSSEESEKLIFKPLFNFKYSDGATMFTFGGMFIQNSEQVKFEKYQFLSYPFISTDNKIIKVDFPIITNKEYILLNEKVPSNSLETFLRKKSIKFIPEKHKKTFFNNYRYYPKFIEMKDL